MKPKGKWKVRVQLVDPQNGQAYREDEYEFQNDRLASNAAFNACEALGEEEGVLTINGEPREKD